MYIYRYIDIYIHKEHFLYMYLYEILVIGQRKIKFVPINSSWSTHVPRGFALALPQVVIVGVPGVCVDSGSVLDSIDNLKEEWVTHRAGMRLRRGRLTGSHARPCASSLHVLCASTYLALLPQSCWQKQSIVIMTEEKIFAFLLSF